MMTADIKTARFEGKTSRDPLAYRFYDASKSVGGKTVNRDDDLLGWDTDQFPNNVPAMTLAFRRGHQGGRPRSGRQEMLESLVNRYVWGSLPVRDV